MSEDKNKPFMVDNLTTVWFFQTLRKNVQAYMQNPKNTAESKRVVASISDAYARLLPEDVREKIGLDLGKKARSLIIKDEDTIAPFLELAATKKRDVKKLDKNIAAQKAQQNKSKKIEQLLLKQIQEEIEQMHKNGRNLDVMADVPVRSIKLTTNQNNKRGYEIYVEGREEPIWLSVLKNKKNFVTSCSVLDVKKGISQAHYKLLDEKGEEGFAFGQVFEKVEARKKVTEKKFRELVGLGAETELSARHQLEFEALNTLEGEEREKMQNALLSRKLKQRNYIETLEKVDALSARLDVCQILDVMKGLIPEEKSALFLREFVNVVANDKENIWKHMNAKEKNEQGGEKRYTYYEILQQRIVSENNNDFHEVFNFSSNPLDKEKMQQNVKKLFDNIKAKSANNPMMDDIVAEIMALGIFNTGINARDNATHEKMNILLNEFGINIKFGRLSVDVGKDAPILDFQAQKTQDRNEFDDLKRDNARGDGYKEFMRSFERNYGVKTPDEASIHHYVALRNNAFVKANLNNELNCVHTAKVSPWNIDLHKLVHTFDTEGEFLVQNQDNSLSYITYNQLRDRVGKGEKDMKILCPMLQLADEKGKFADVMPHPELGKYASLISDNSTPVIYAKVPQYCKDDGGKGFTSIKSVTERE